MAAWIFIAEYGLSLVASGADTLRCIVQASHCNDFSSCGARMLGVQVQ